MSRRDRSGARPEPARTEAAPAVSTSVAPPAPPAASAASSFDVANDLLMAALDAVRGGAATAPPTPAPPSNPAARPEPVRPAQSAQEPAAADAERELWAANPVVDSTRRRRRDAQSASAPSAADASAAHRVRRRTRRAPDEPVQEPAETAGDEFDDLAEIFRPKPTSPNRRRAAGTATVAGASAAAQAAAASAAAAPSPTVGPDADLATPATSTAPGVSPTQPPSTQEARARSWADETSEPSPTSRRPTPQPAVAAATTQLPTAVAADARRAHSTSSATAHHPSRRKQLTVVAAAVGALLVAAIGFALVSGGGSDGPETALETPPGARLTFPIATTPEGAQFTRVWTLRGATGDRFVGQLQFENRTAAPMVATHTETIPKSLARSVTEIRFDPQPVVVNPDPVVRYSIAIPAGASFTARYVIDVPAQGADRSRLEEWADDVSTTPSTTTTRSSSTTTTQPAQSGTTPTTSRTAASGNRSNPSGSGGGGGGNASPGGNSGGGSSPPATSPPVEPTSPPVTPTSPPPTSPPPPPPTTAPPKGTMVIWLRSKGGTGTFAFGSPFGNIVLDTGPGNGEASTGFTVDTGTYPVTLQVPAGWSFNGVGCTAGGSSSGTTATYNVAANGTVRCTFTVTRN